MPVLQCSFLSHFVTYKHAMKPIYRAASLQHSEYTAFLPSLGMEAGCLQSAAKQCLKHLKHLNFLILLLRNQMLISAGGRVVGPWMNSLTWYYKSHALLCGKVLFLIWYLCDSWFVNLGIDRSCTGPCKTFPCPSHLLHCQCSYFMFNLPRELPRETKPSLKREDSELRYQLQLCGTRLGPHLELTRVAVSCWLKTPEIETVSFLW